ncbi:hypothetical protein MUK42_33739 [Musa troglodytarum]|uniref:Uncharacterized protein n=1 Tax=Musa troglodytarum TaxID=320322 RepID=A0A9E7EEK7_9LILI|nr:hypothetical protein MUK42_33739 [Musa troglodytarum]
MLGLEAYGLVEQLVCSISTISSENRRQLLENTMSRGTASITGSFSAQSSSHIFLPIFLIRESFVTAPENTCQRTYQRIQPRWVVPYWPKLFSLRTSM